MIKRENCHTVWHKRAEKVSDIIWMALHTWGVAGHIATCGTSDGLLGFSGILAYAVFSCEIVAEPWDVYNDRISM